MAILGYRELDVWRKAMVLVTQCYRATEGFPRSETYGLTGQLRRAAVSVPANIAEGQGRQHTTEFIQFLSIANGSLMELETHILIAVQLNYLEQSRADSLLQVSADISKMLSRLRSALLQKAKITV